MPFIDHLFAYGPVRKLIWKLWYPYITRRLREDEVLFLNYSFEPSEPMNLPLAPVWARVMLIPRSLLFGTILVLASVGAYSLNRSLLDVGILYAVGTVGLGMRVLDVPLVPAVLGLILGPLAEQQFRRAVAISEGDLAVFVQRPIAAALLVVASAVLVLPLFLRATAGTGGASR